MKSNKIIAINGEAFCRNLTGIERLAIEVTNYLDNLVQPGQMELVVPGNAVNVPELKNIPVITLPTKASFMPKWTQIDFQGYVLKKKRIPLNFANTCPYFAPGFSFIHDIYCKLYPEDLHSMRDRLIRLYSNIMYRRIAKKSPGIFTVSEYTKKTITDTYGTNPEKIHVVYSGVSDYNKIPADESIFEKLPILKQKDFFFTLGSLSARKNLAWIARHAELYPNEFFAISGKPLPSVVAPELEKLKTLNNVLITGYLNDGEVKALLTKCRAFVLPTYFEGFGLPPLEALSCGAKIIISEVTSLPEIYGKCAHYINPNEPDIDLSELLSEPVDEPALLLEKYTLENTAKRMYDNIKNYLIGNN